LSSVDTGPAHAPGDVADRRQRAPRRLAVAPVAQRDLGDRQQLADRIAQLVRDVGARAALALERDVDAADQRVGLLGHGRELDRQLADVEPLGQAVDADAVERGGEPVRGLEPALHGAPRERRDQRDQRQRSGDALHEHRALGGDQLLAPAGDHDDDVRGVRTLRTFLGEDVVHLDELRHVAAGPPVGQRGGPPARRARRRARDGEVPTVQGIGAFEQLAVLEAQLEEVGQLRALVLGHQLVGELELDVIRFLEQHRREAEHPVGEVAVELRGERARDREIDGEPGEREHERRAAQQSRQQVRADRSHARASSRT
jgi:hypothetical protein